MSATAKRLLTVGAIALLSACSPPQIDISVERLGGRMVVHLSQDWGVIISNRKAPCVREVGLHEPHTDQPDKAAWLIEAKGDVQCVHLGSVAVGEVPNGWKEVTPLTAVRGRPYTVSAHGFGWGETDIRY